MNLQQKIEMLKDSKILSSEPIFDSINPKKISGIYLKVALKNGKQATIEILGCDNYTEKCKVNNFDVIITKTNKKITVSKSKTAIIL